MNKYSRKEILEFLKSQFLMNIATSHEDKPASSVLLYAVDDDFNFYFVTHEESHKSQNLQKNPKVGLSVWRLGEMMVQADCEAEMIDDDEEEEAAMNKLAEAVTLGVDFWPPFFRIKGNQYVIFKLKPYWLRAFDLQRNTIRQEDSPFTELEL